MKTTIKTARIEVTEGDITFYIVVGEGRITIENAINHKEFVFDVSTDRVDEKRIEKWFKVAKLLQKTTEVVAKIRKGELSLPIEIK